MNEHWIYSGIAVSALPDTSGVRAEEPDRRHGSLCLIPFSKPTTFVYNTENARSSHKSEKWSWI